MAYEIYTRSATRIDTPAISVSASGRMSLNAAASRVLEKADVNSVVLLWDKRRTRFALRATGERDANSFRISYSDHRALGTLTARVFLKHIGWRAKRTMMLPAIWNAAERMLEADVPKSCLRLSAEAGGQDE